jgi:solute carrier family 35 protein E1
MSYIDFITIINNTDVPLLLNFLFWYLGNYYYNIQNKTASNASGGSKFAMTIATFQLAVGVMYSSFLWIIPDARSYPKITLHDIMVMIPSGICSALAHAFSVFSLASGGVAFGQIVKASEPVFAAVIGTLLYNKKISYYRWLCLFVIIFGVCLASLKVEKNGSYEMDFDLYAMIGAILANIFASFKGAESKKIIETPGLNSRIGSVSNQYSVMNIISFIVSLPIMFIFEGYHINEFKFLILNNNIVYINIILSGLTFYGYNELSTMTLKKISAVNQSVANTAKRVIIIIGSAIVFNENISGLKAVGCVLCIGGVFLDSIIDDIMIKIKRE